MKRYKDFVHSVMDQECKNPLAELANSVILGGDDIYRRNQNKDF